MPLPHQPIVVWPYAFEDLFFGANDSAGWIISESAPEYRPRHPEHSAFYQLFENHFDSYVRCYEERFESSSGPLRPVVVRSVEEFLACGRLQGGFARIRCPKCHAEHLLAFSCRSYYTSCVQVVVAMNVAAPQLSGFSYMCCPMSFNMMEPRPSEP
jgi:hypothetical protein